jgi:hypothetical protein
MFAEDAISFASSNQYDNQYDQPIAFAATNPFAQYSTNMSAAGADDADDANGNELSEVCIEFGAGEQNKKKPRKKASKKQHKQKVSIKIKSEPGNSPSYPPAPPPEQLPVESSTMVGYTQGIDFTGGFTTQAASNPAAVAAAKALKETDAAENVKKRKLARSPDEGGDHSQMGAGGAGGAGLKMHIGATTLNLSPGGGGGGSGGGGAELSMGGAGAMVVQSNSKSNGAGASATVQTGGGAAVAGAGTAANAPMLVQLQWVPHYREQWHTLLDGYGRPAGNFQFNVQVDKGFSHSPQDQAFVCQRKNHFQMTVTMDMLDQPRFAQLVPGRMLQPIQEVFLCVHGIKAEANTTAIPIEQAQVDRSKCILQPIRVKLTEGTHSKVTLARLHFSETTANNMRKRGKPNPEQRFFNLVISVVANLEGTNVTLSSVKSRDIIVRASNLGQFPGEDADGGDAQWTKAQGPKAIAHFGAVGINTKTPGEALSVHGNVQVTGSVLQPSDARLKENFRPLDTKKQLENIRRITVYDYDLKEEWTNVSGRQGQRVSEAGVVAQQVATIIPSAVRPTGTNVALSDGTVVDNLLMVNKERIFIENVGAVQELCRMTENLEQRIQELEALNSAVQISAKEERIATLSRQAGGRGSRSRGRAMGMHKFPLLRTLLYCGVVMLLFSAMAIGIVFAANEANGSSDAPSPSQSVRPALPPPT